MQLSRSEEYPLAVRTTQRAMGTIMSHQAFGPHAPGCLEAVCGEVSRIEGLLSRFIPGSDIERLNRSAGVQSVEVHPDTFDVLCAAAKYSQWFEGCFDVTIAPLVALWNINQEVFAEPDEASIQRILPLVNHRDLLLDPINMTAGLRKPGQSVDLGGIGKGFAAARLLDVFTADGAASSIPGRRAA